MAPQKVEYRYQLVGFDPGWVEAGTRRTAYYTNLPHGRYTFRVMARNNDGVWSREAATVALTVEPHMYQTVWFRLLLALALMGWPMRPGGGGCCGWSGSSRRCWASEPASRARFTIRWLRGSWLSRCSWSWWGS